MTLPGLTPGWARIFAIRFEMTSVLPDPAQAMICNGWSTQAMAWAWEVVYEGIANILEYQRYSTNATQY
jgi:hypothetical protein